MSVCYLISRAPERVSLCLFAVLSVLIFISAKASGGVLNPAVALLLWVVGEFRWPKAAGYVVAEVSGAVCGALVGWVIDIGYSYDSWGVDHTGPGCGPVDVNETHYAPIFVWELLGTFVLVCISCSRSVLPARARHHP